MKDDVLYHINYGGARTELNRDVDADEVKMEGAYKVYANSELLETKDIVTRTTLMGSDMAYYEITPHTHRHYAVCTSCGAMLPLHTCPVVEMPKELSEAGFTVTEHHLEIAGICKKCKNKK